MTITFSCGTLNFIDFIESLVNLWNSAVMLLLSFLFYSTIIQTNVGVSIQTRQEKQPTALHNSECKSSLFLNSWRSKTLTYYRWNFDAIYRNSRDTSISGLGGHIVISAVVGRWRSHLGALSLNSPWLKPQNCRWNFDAIYRSSRYISISGLGDHIAISVVGRC